MLIVTPPVKAVLVPVNLTMALLMVLEPPALMVSAPLFEIGPLKVVTEFVSVKMALADCIEIAFVMTAVFSAFENVPPFITSNPVPSAFTLDTVSQPALLVTPPPKVLAAVKVRLLAPTLVRAKLAPLSVMMPR